MYIYLYINILKSRILDLLPIEILFVNQYCENILYRIESEISY